MAGRKTSVKKAKRAAKPAAKAKKKATAAKPAVKAKAKPAKKSLLARAVRGMTNLLTSKKPKKAASREFGEGNYKASKRFRDKEEAFVKKNKSRIPKLGKAAEEALDGPQGDALRAAEAAAAAGHAVD